MNVAALFSRIKVSRLVSSAVAITIVLSAILIATATNRGATAGVPVDMVRRETVKELPPEWQWEQPGVEWEHMHMSGRKRQSAYPDWIRESGR